MTLTGVPGDLIVSEKNLGNDEDVNYSVCYGVRSGDIVSGTDDPEVFTSVTGAIAENGTVYTVETESAASNAAAAD